MSLPSAAPDADLWDDFVSRHQAGHVLQSSRWSLLKSQHGWRCSQTLAPNAHPAAAAAVFCRPLPRGLGTIAYCPRGPVLDWGNSDARAIGLNAALAAARRAGAFGLVIEPELDDTPQMRAVLTAAGFAPFLRDVQPRRSIVIDIHSADENEVLARMKSKTRYNIGLARRKGVTVRQGTVADAAAYHALMQMTAERDGFAIHPLTYYEDFLRIFCGESSSGALFLAEHDGELLAALIATAYGTKAVYLYGASSNAKRELMPTYVLQWEALRWARLRGCTRYDLWGVPDEDEATLEAGFESRHDGLWGVYRFKRGFGGQLTRSIGAWGRAISRLRWWVYLQAIQRRGVHGLAA
jgi:lipid II:glycine glycyltransferase (peptidoglycan interpeptide bridge formation enzyme)